MSSAVSQAIDILEKRDGGIEFLRSYDFAQILFCGSQLACSELALSYFLDDSLTYEESEEYDEKLEKALERKQYDSYVFCYNRKWMDTIEDIEKRIEIRYRDVLENEDITSTEFPALLPNPHYPIPVFPVSFVWLQCDIWHRLGSQPSAF